MSPNRLIHPATARRRRFEIMDGSPVRNETIPVRLFLNSYRLTPTYHDTDKQFSVRYFLNLVLLDQEERRYFKQQEITLWRSLPQDAVVPEATRLAATNHYLAPSGSS
ncbi:hypothetical protein H696_06313 [Fonticula alba]|uniref:Vacuolar protein sorting-associated protein 26 n=1 Tax=Fonticula alba TaxID=691883 RepID=A0A058YZG3_FONAL|nr:hypothetical protein H696_06313 [Fonticula alba]KCV67266.1 hypothetical protein H696_06313 [Fonticula alba]|eukprot:XP_009498330.1 hypothetical protein H696_06313 [Fonticula alba]